MKNRKLGFKLNRGTKGRLALSRAHTASLVKYGKIETTLTKAKATQPFIEKTITMVRKGGLARRRRVLARLGNDKLTTELLFGKYLPLAQSKKSGFTRVIKLGSRKGDRGERARLEWTGQIEEETKGKKKVKKKDKKEKK